MTAKKNSRERILEFVRHGIQHGHPPTVREVQQAMGFRAVQSARQHLEALVAEGALLKNGGQARGYRLPERETTPTRLVPLVGRVQAGALQDAIEHSDGFVAVEARSSTKASNDQSFALRVRGESMINAGILDGDIVIVRKQSTAAHNDIVVAMVGDEATVKTLRVHKHHVELRPENPAFAPIVVKPPSNLSILGKVVEVRRYLDGFRDVSPMEKRP